MNALDCNHPDELNMNAQLVTAENATPIGYHMWAIDASDLRIPPGHPAPDRLPTTLGNGQDFLLIGPMCYRQELGSLVLNVLNT